MDLMTANTELPITKLTDAQPDASSREPAIHVEGVSKRFKVYHSPMGRIADFVRPRPGRYEEVWALRDVSFRVERGECFGIVGVNGSGKSTLLKLITSTLLPTTGDIRVRGRVLALLELGGGINPELTGRQNVVVSAAMLGFPEDYAASKMAQIAAFADIGDFFDRPMRIYSSGMYVRLAFSIYLFMEPEILIVDEALSVGDIFFQQKCYAALREIMDSGTTVLFVSHDTGAVQKLCKRAMLLNHGRVDFVGLPDATVTRYYTTLGQKTAATRTAVAATPAAASDAHHEHGLPAVVSADAVLAGNQIPATLHSAGDEVSLIALRATGADGKPAVSLKVGTDLVLDVLLEAFIAAPRPDVTISLYDRFGNLVFRTSFARIGQPVAALAAGQRALVRLAVGCHLPVGQFTYRIGVSANGEPVADPSPAISAMLGPVVIDWDKPTSRFYGQIGIPSTLLAATTRAEVTHPTSPLCGSQCLDRNAASLCRDGHGRVLAYHSAVDADRAVRVHLLRLVSHPSGCHRSGQFTGLYNVGDAAVAGICRLPGALHHVADG
jgi:lipopolysaccharide transport system ATP-binding protein